MQHLHDIGPSVEPAIGGVPLAKKQRKPSSEALRLAEQSPTAWFVQLEIARQKGDVEAERRALQKLQELGVRVVFEGPPRRGSVK